MTAPLDLAAEAYMPRIDLIAEHQTSGHVHTINGTPTAHATLDNMAGAPPLPADHKLWAYVLIPPHRGQHSHLLRLRTTPKR